MLSIEIIAAKPTQLVIFGCKCSIKGIKAELGLLYALIILLFCAVPVFSQERALSAPEPSFRSIEVPLSLDRIHPAGDGLILGVSRQEQIFVLYDLDAEQTVKDLPMNGRPHAEAVFVQPNGTVELALLVEEETSIFTLHQFFVVPETGEVIFSRSYENVSKGFSDPGVSFFGASLTKSEFNPEDSRSNVEGRTVIVWDRDGSNGPSEISWFRGEETRSVPVKVAPHYLLPIGSEDWMLAVNPDFEAASIIDPTSGDVYDRVAIDRLNNLRLSEVFVSSAQFGGDGQIVYASGRNQQLTALVVGEVSQTRGPLIEPPLQIAVDLGNSSDLLDFWVVGDTALSTILVGAVSTPQVQIFRRIKGGITAIGLYELPEPVLDAIVLRNPEQSGNPELFAFLEQDATTITLASVDDFEPKVADDPDAIEPPDVASETRGQTVLDPAGIGEIQRVLADLGYPVGGVDGIIGPRTTAAIQAFQDDNRIEANGELNEATLAELAAASLRLEETLGPNDIEEIQRVLASFGYAVGAIDGLLSTRTVAAIRAYQSDNQLDLTGKLDEPTLARINAAIRGGDQGAPQYAPIRAYADFLRDTANTTEASAVAARIMTLGGSNESPSSQCFGLNDYPDERFWPNSIKFVRLLERLEMDMGLNVQINSTHRAPVYNRCIFGASVSLHQSFAAFDIVADDVATTVAALKQLEADGLTSIRLVEFDSFVHVETPIGNWHAVIASYSVTPRGCDFARDDVDEFADLLAGTELSGREVMIARTNISNNYAVTVDLNNDRSAALAAVEVIRSRSTLSADSRTGRDSFVQTNKNWEIDSNCNWVRIIPSETKKVP